jgi:glutamate/tyrosine decarboxylase-like PLP-dependent enzyme
MQDQYEAALAEAHTHALRYLSTLVDRAVPGITDPAAVARLIESDLPETAVDARQVVADLVAAVEPGLTASNGPRYFGFVTGGTLPAAMAADWLTSAWDQNTALWVMSPGAVAVQNVATAWLLDLLDLPRDAGVGLVTGAQMANWTCLAAARHEVLARAGWDVERLGLQGAPPVTVVVGEHRHGTIDRALRFLGFGSEATTVVPSDDQGRMRPGELARALRSVAGPLLVCAQAGEVNTGAFDPMGAIVDLARERGGWVHVDGAFGLWARACGETRWLTDGVAGADSWTIDGHKWLNMPYDTGFAITAHPDAHVVAMMELAPYLVAQDDVRRDPWNWGPDASRRARGFAAYAAMRSLGRAGIDNMIAGSCRLARRFAERLGGLAGVEILNEVVLNQVLVRFVGNGDPDSHTRAVIERVQANGTCWVGGTTFRGKAAMRISVSGWSTTEADVDRSVDAIAHCAGLG